MPTHRQARIAAESAEEALFADVDTFADWLGAECMKRTETGLPVLSDREAETTDWNQRRPEGHFYIPTPRLFAFVLDPRQGAMTTWRARNALTDRYKVEKDEYLRRLYDDSLIEQMGDEREAA